MESHFVILITIILGLGLAYVASTRDTRWWKSSQREPQKPRHKPRPRFQTVRISNIPRHIPRHILSEKINTLSRDSASSAEHNVIGLSYAPAAASILTQRFQVATVTFLVEPDLALLESSLRSELGIDASRLKIDSDFFGLTPLHGTLEDSTVDIVAVTGLAGHAFGSWKARGQPAMWLRDFLPDVVPKTRIMTYGYDTKLPGSQSEASIMDLSRKLLESIKTARAGESKSRPLVLIGHSLGGLVVKQAMVEACEGSEEDKTVFMSCYGLMLFGVPNRGLNNANLMAMVHGQPNESLVRDLSGSSRFLSLLHRLFSEKFILEESIIISIYETKTTATVEWSEATGSWERTGPEVMMVGHTSATHAGHHEKTFDQISIDANHSDLVKFDDPSQPDYVIIAERISRLVDIGPTVVKARFAEYRRKLSRLEKQFCDSLHAPNYVGVKNNMIDEPTPGTLNWFLSTPEFSSWETREDSSILWIQGSAGQGKTLLAKYLLNYLEKSVARQGSKAVVIYFFFYDREEILSSVGAVLRVLIRQLLDVRNVDTFSVIAEKVELDKSMLSDDGLWEILERLLSAHVLGNITCVIDGLDECRDPTGLVRLLRLFERITRHIPTSRHVDTPTLKTIFLSRTAIDMERHVSKFSRVYLKANPSDLDIFIRHEIKYLQLNDDLQEYTVRSLLGRAGQTFLWVSIVLKKLKAEALISEADIDRLIDESPLDLEDLYEKIVTDIMDRNGEAQKKLLLWVVYGRRPLTLSELEEAISVQENSDSLEATRRFKTQLTRTTVISAVGVILEIGDDNRVTLIHQSAKEFLTRKRHLFVTELCRGLKPDLYLGKICMVYLCFKNFRVETWDDPIELGLANRPDLFIQYAARNWHRHLEKHTDDAGTLRSLILRLTEARSPTLATWLQVAGFSVQIAEESRWGLASRVNIPWLAGMEEEDGVSSLHEVLKANDLRNADPAWFAESSHDALIASLQQSGIEITTDAFCRVARDYDQKAVQLLLEKWADASIPSSVWAAAARNMRYGMSIFRLFLERDHHVTVTEELMNSILLNRQSRSTMIDLLARDEKTSFDMRACVELASSPYFSPAETLLSLREDCYSIEVFRALASRRGSIPSEVMASLLQKCDENAKMTDAEISYLGSHYKPWVFQFFLERFGHCFDFTEGLVKSVVQFADATWITTLLETHGKDFIVTTEVLRCAVLNRTSEGMRILFRERGDQIKVEPQVVKRVAKEGTPEMLSLLLDERPREAQVTIDVYKAAISNRDQPATMVALLLDRCAAKLEITSKVIKLISRNPVHYMSVMRLLLDRCGETLLREESLCMVVLRGRDEMLTTVLDVQGSKARITESVLGAATQSLESSMARLLDVPGAKEEITDKVCTLAAAAGNSKVLEILCAARGIPVKDEWVNLANFRSAVSQRDVALVRKVLPKVANPDQKDILGVTAFIHSVERGFTEIIQLLGQHVNVDVNAQDAKGRSAISYAARHGFHENAVIVLMQLGADPHLADDNGNTAITEAARLGYGHVIQNIYKFVSGTADYPPLVPDQMRYDDPGQEHEKMETKTDLPEDDERPRGRNRLRQPSRRRNQRILR